MSRGLLRCKSNGAEVVSARVSVLTQSRLVLALMRCPLASRTPVARPSVVSIWATWALSWIWPPCFFSPLRHDVDQQLDWGGVLRCFLLRSCWLIMQAMYTYGAAANSDAAERYSN